MPFKHSAKVKTCRNLSGARIRYEYHYPLYLRYLFILLSLRAKKFCRCWCWKMQNIDEMSSRQAASTAPS